MIQIQVTEQVSPKNVATLDRPDLSLVGNTFSKQQTRDEIGKLVVAGVKGEATTTTIPTIYNPTTHPNGLFEKYDVKTAGTFTNFKDSSDIAIIVTASDLQSNYVQLWVQNGVASKVLSAINQITSTAKIETWSAKAFTNGSQVLHENTLFEATENTLSPDIPGISSKWLEILKNESELLDYFTHGKLIIEGKIALDSSIHGNFSLTNDNTIVGTNPNVYNKINIPTNGRNFLYYDAIRPRENSASLNIYVAAVGIKSDGTKITLLSSSDIADMENQSIFELNIQEYVSISLAWLKDSVDANFYLYNSKETRKKDVVKEYIDESVADLKKIAKFFLTKDNFTNKTTIDISSPNPQALRVDNVSIGGGNVYNKMNILTNGRKFLYYNAIRPREGSPNDYTYVAVVGIKSDGTTAMLLPSSLISNAEPRSIFKIDVENYIRVSIAWSGLAEPELFFYDEFSVIVEENWIKNYIDNKQSGGGSFSAENTMIFAEAHGVGLGTPQQNTDILNNLLTITKYTGIPIYLPAKPIEITNTLQAYSRSRLIGASWGGTNSGGTRIFSNNANLLLNINNSNTVEEDIQDGLIAEITFDGLNVTPKGFETTAGTAYFRFSRCNFTNFTEYGGKLVGSLICDFDRCRFRESPKGIIVENAEYYKANLITFNLCQFTIMSLLGCEINGGASITFNQCDWEQCGTNGNSESGCVLGTSMSVNGEGVDLTFNGCWSEFVYGGFWLKLGGNQGVTTFRDTMLWRLHGLAPTAIISNNSRLLITGSTRIQGFPQSVITSGGETRVDGFSRLDGTHVEINGGIFKTANYS